MKTKKKFSLLIMLTLLGLLPLLCITLIANISIVKSLRKEMKNDVRVKLAVACEGLNQYYSKIWDNLDENDFSYVDSLKEKEVELTLFEGDTILLSSMTNSKGERIIGTKADNDIIKEVLDKGGTYFSDDAIINGEEYYVCYTPIKINQETVGMVLAAESRLKVKAIITESINHTGRASFVCMILFTIMTIFVAIIFRKPLRKITEELKIIADGNLTNKIEINSAIFESNQMIESTKTIQTNLKKIVSNTKDKADELTEGVNEISELSTSLSDGAEQINKAVEELSLAAGSLAENVQDVNNEVISIGDDINSISENIVNLNDSSEKIAQSSNKAKDYINEVLESSKKSVEAVENISEQINLTNKSMQKINEAVEFIQSITDRTKMLSLNASIEAARAGEAGKGFNVVAESIRQLSEQSNEGANEIKNIANEIFIQSKQSVQLADDVKQIINEEQIKINETNKSFIQLDNEIKKSAEQIENINNKTNILTESKNNIISSITDLSAISEENAASNQEVAANVESINNDISVLKDKANNMTEIATELEEKISIFKIDDKKE